MILRRYGRFGSGACIPVKGYPYPEVYSCPGTGVFKAGASCPAARSPGLYQCADGTTVQLPVVTAAPPVIPVLPGIDPSALSVTPKNVPMIDQMGLPGIEIAASEGTGPITIQQAPEFPWIPWALGTVATMGFAYLIAR